MTKKEKSGKEATEVPPPLSASPDVPLAVEKLTSHTTRRLACMAISLIGDRFTDRPTQLVLLGILNRTEEKFGWPTSLM
jgi:hypothetical protein